MTTSIDTTLTNRKAMAMTQLMTSTEAMTITVLTEMLTSTSGATMMAASGKVATSTSMGAVAEYWIGVPLAILQVNLLSMTQILSTWLNYMIWLPL